MIPASWEGETKLRVKTCFPWGLAFHPNFLKQLLFPGAAASPGPPRTPGGGVPEELFKKTVHKIISVDHEIHTPMVCAAGVEWPTLIMIRKKNKEKV